jgi:hypothetical protein
MKRAVVVMVIFFMIGIVTGQYFCRNYSNVIPESSNIQVVNNTNNFEMNDLAKNESRIYERMRIVLKSSSVNYNYFIESSLMFVDEQRDNSEFCNDLKTIPLESIEKLLEPGLPDVKFYADNGLIIKIMSAYGAKRSVKELAGILFYCDDQNNLRCEDRYGNILASSSNHNDREKFLTNDVVKILLFEKKFKIIQSSPKVKDNGIDFSQKYIPSSVDLAMRKYKEIGGNSFFVASRNNDNKSANLFVHLLLNGGKRTNKKVDYEIFSRKIPIYLEGNIIDWVIKRKVIDKNGNIIFVDDLKKEYKDKKSLEEKIIFDRKGKIIIKQIEISGLG